MKNLESVGKFLSDNFDKMSKPIENPTIIEDTNDCDLSDCCGAEIMWGDICSKCFEHCEIHEP